MPPTTIVLRCSGPYARALARTLAAARRAGVQVDSLPSLTELALTELAARHGITLPRRAAPHGTNRYGEPRAVE